MLAETNLSFKVFLLVDNAPGHPKVLKVAHLDVGVIFLPPNTVSLIQPLDEGVISPFKTYYTRRILDTMESDPKLTIRKC